MASPASPPSTTPPSAKRPHSAISAPAAPGTTKATKPRVALLYLNTLLASHAAVTHTIRALLLTTTTTTTTNGTTNEPTTTPPTDTQILTAFATSPSLPAILTTLRPGSISHPPSNQTAQPQPQPQDRQATPDEHARLAEAYVRIYAAQGLPLLELAPGARELLAAMARDGVRVVVVVARGGDEEHAHAPDEDGGDDGQDGAAAVAVGLLERFGVAGLVGGVMVVSAAAAALPVDGGAVEKGEGGGAFKRVWDGMVEPWVKGGRVEELEVVVVSRAVYDLGAAKEIGARGCWVRGFGVEQRLGMGAGVEPDLVVEGLEELGAKMFAADHGELEVVELMDGDDD
ncbi:hypothetical protein BT67DRAFT_455832 [Trichocladium antarcticum]|uniref:Uncharacterized protein n=1 Tax=Trichocladium antarcticum TaxID=1450529 RepID=A0AAN6UMH5_9PEZI|nr:hypothetical protein BT67DRAFT_455832 [Trichocladium antarcticum]